VSPVPYVPLWCKSNFSFLEGASHPQELLETAAELGLPALALTDRDGVYGMVEAHVEARVRGVKLLAGSQVTVADGSSIVLLATDRRGWGSLCRLLSVGRLRSPKGECRVEWREVAEHAEGLLALWGGDGSLIAGEADPFFVAHALREAFGDRLYALAARHRRADEGLQEARLRARAERWGIPVAAAHEALYHRASRRDLQDVLTCIRFGVRLTEAGRRIRSNAEYALKSSHAFAHLFADDAAGIARTREISDRCAFSLGQIRYVYPAEHLPDGMTGSQWLRVLTFEGARGRYRGQVPQTVAGQLDRELAVIEDLDYGGYFLTMHEIVRYCRESGILCQGRGSAANSAVCYCLGITAVDPVAMGLLFERFLSRERAEPPDIDLDIEHERREEVIQHVYAKYGRRHAAMVAITVRYRPKSAVRDVGKVFGIPETALDRAAKMLGYHEGEAGTAFAQAGLDPELPAHRHVLRLVSEVQDFPRHLSIHPGGFLLGHEPVDTLVPIENGAMPDRTVIQWDKDALEELGLFKVDLLGLGALHQLHLGFDLLALHRGLRLGLADLPLDDEPTFAMIRGADTVGVFQIESRAQMAMLPRLLPKTWYDLVIEVSIVRPGPITGGMVHPYLRRRAGQEDVDYPHPSLEPILARTLGIPLFQEQVIRLAMVAADYTPGEADQLRRDMAAWRRSGRLEGHRERLVRRMTEKGIALEFAERVFEQIKGFGEYGFPESHAASFALIAYATAWMRCHHPEVFTCSLLNAQPMGFYSAATVVDDAKRHGVRFLPVDVARSAWDCTLEEEGGKLLVRLGLRYVKGLAKASAGRLLEARQARPFASVADLVARAGMDEGALTRMAEAGALSSLDPGRREALWAVRGAARVPGPDLLVVDAEAPVVFTALDAFQTIGWDYRATGLSPRGHPLEPLRETLAAARLPEARAVARLPDGRRVHYAGIVICRQRPGTASGVVFLTMEDETGFVNVVVWRKVYESYRSLVKTASFLGVSGKLQAESGVVHLIAESFWSPRTRLQPPSGGSRNFR
jgi:error-prone DNA polymerase